MERITSVKNATVRAMRELKDRRTRQETGRILVEGEVMIREALSCGLRIYELLAEERCELLAQEMAAQGARAFIVPRSILETVCETRTPQGVCASFSRPVELPVEALPEVVVALDGVQDPGNVGTIWRTADAAGFQALLLGEGSADPLSPKVLR
ncbi:MAG: TrmH family RNA methyltransferase, partial [Candidatus Faecivicinus sp.]